MITSLVLTGTHHIGTDSYDKFMVEDNKISIKDVPFVRYRFDKYDEQDIKYIKNMKNKFKYSSHMAEITIGENTGDIIDKLEAVENLIKFVYLEIDDTDVENGISKEKLNTLNGLKGKFYDRLMIKDKSTKLDTVTSERFKLLISQYTSVKWDDIGVCSSPLSFDGKNACLTAVKARELSAKYSETDEAALPSANHECMNCCGCIRYFKIEHDVVAPISGKTSSKTFTKKDGDKKVSKTTKPKGFLKW